MADTVLFHGPLSEQYRPQSWADVVGQDKVVQRVQSPAMRGLAGRVYWIGALLAELPSGVRFAVGTGLSDAERSNPLPVGSTFPFRYQELTDGGVPRFPSYIDVRSIGPSPDPNLPLLQGESAMASTITPRCFT